MKLPTHTKTDNKSSFALPWFWSGTYLKNLQSLLRIVLVWFAVIILTAGYKTAFADGSHNDEKSQREYSDKRSNHDDSEGSEKFLCFFSDNKCWEIAVESDGIYELSFSYSLKRRDSRRMDVFIDNEVVKNNQEFLSTGSSSIYNESKLYVYLTAGEHVVKLHNGRHKSLFINSVTASFMATSQQKEIVNYTRRYEAEESLLNNAKISNIQSGYSGAGYVEFDKKGVSKFIVDIKSSGEYELLFRYAQNKHKWRIALFVDGQFKQTETFTSSVKKELKEHRSSKSHDGRKDDKEIKENRSTKSDDRHKSKSDDRRKVDQEWKEYRYTLNLDKGIHSIQFKSKDSHSGLLDYMSTLSLSDRDGDGVPDDDDAFPDDPSEWSDLDGDGIGDNSDTDRDGDGISNDYEQQLGTDPNDPNSTPPDLDNDGIPDQLDADRDGDGISNDYEEQLGTDPNDANSTPPDLDKDGIPDQLDDDRDGDGVSNAEDSYSDDASRTQLAPVTNLNAVLQNNLLLVSWDLHPENFVTGYQLSRSDYGADNWVPLNAGNLITGSTYLDQEVSNGQAYQYRVIAVDDRANLGLATAAISHFVLFNQNTIDAAYANWQNYLAEVTWTHTLQANESFHVYKIEGNNRQLIYQGLEPRFIDNSSHWNTAQSYEIATVFTFTNPISAVQEQAEGQATAVKLAALPAIKVSLPEAIALTPLSYRIELQSEAQLSISGIYQDAIGEMHISLTTSDGVTTTTSTDGTFQFVVRNVSVQLMTIDLVETGAPVDRNLQLSLDVTPDQTPLTVLIDANTNVSTNQSQINLGGQVINAERGLSELVAVNARYPGQDIGLVSLKNNAFSGEVPLKTGDNIITVTAVGNSGETATASTTITRLTNAIPAIEFTSHQNNQVVTTPQINLAGRLYSSLPMTDLQVLVGEQPAILSMVSNQLYQFNLNQITLQRGYNRLVVLAKTPIGNVESAIVIYYQDTTVDPVLPLELKVSSPLEGQAINSEVLIVRGQLFNAGSDAQVTINGEVTQLFGTASAGYLFSHPFDLSAIAEGSYTFDVVASSNDKDAVTETMTILVDNQPPQLSLDNNLAAAPTVNEVQQQPYRISGSVSDANLASLSINGQGLTTQPLGADSYAFDTQVNFTVGEQTTLTLLATDSAGNAKTLEYEILSNPQVAIEVIQPLNQSEFLTTGATHDLQYIVRLTGITGGENLVISAGTAQQTIPVTQTVIDGALTIDTTEDIKRLSFEVQNAASEVLASTAIAVNLINQDNLPLTLIKTSPARNERDREPHFPIQFYFNKPVSLADLQVSVRQTYHGTTYKNTAASGAGFSEKYKGEVIEVHQDQQPVAGGLSLLPGERIVEFYPEQDISFGASVFVEIAYQGNELERFIYQVRNTPTFANITLIDQNNNLLEGIKVSIPELNIEGVSDNNGSYTFNGKGTEQNTIPSNLYRIVVNPAQSNPQFGIAEKMVQIENGQFNKLGSITLPALNPEVPYRSLQSGISNNTLVDGDLIIDTSKARLEFPDGGEQGNVHIQVADYGDNSYRPIDINMTPLWVFNLQPGNIKVNGSIQLQIKMPRLYGGYEYVPANGSPVLLMGLDPESLKLKPIGVGTVQNKVVISQGNVAAKRLDYLGYTLVSSEQYPLLQQYLDDQINIDQLTNTLLQQ